ncbi:DUF2087 domain-containing protein [Cognatishimia activa]|uniref:DUF2087 domain-containing protein n=1 Tax=Cognatishimia activa TaxID=1715691 RepID=A0A975ENT4_9RHOB|nr:DUF2087 domain-containing protein [Cognatishimia activa]QTN35450.1 DUF2087 domain-containing protein [Cognatishimia activa]
MAQDLTPLYIADLSTFTKTLRKSLDGAPVPGHAQFMSLVARAAGFKNTQHLKAQQPEPRGLSKDTQRALRFMDAEGRMSGWPRRTQVQALCLWAIWRFLPAKQDLTEKDVNEVLKTRATFGDHVQIRRSLIENGLMKRTIDGAVYRRIERKPAEEAQLFLRALMKR